MKQKAREWGVWSKEFIYPMIKFDLDGTQTSQPGVEPMTEEKKHLVKGIYFPIYRLLVKLVRGFPKCKSKLYITPEQKAMLKDTDNPDGVAIKSLVAKSNSVDVALAKRSGEGVHQSDLSGDEVSSNGEEEDEEEEKEDN